MTKLTDLLMIYYRLTIEGVSDITAKEYFTMTDKEREEYEKNPKKVRVIAEFEDNKTPPYDKYIGCSFNAIVDQDYLNKHGVSELLEDFINRMEIKYNLKDTVYLISNRNELDHVFIDKWYLRFANK